MRLRRGERVRAVHPSGEARLGTVLDVHDVIDAIEARGVQNSQLIKVLFDDGAQSDWIETADVRSTDAEPEPDTESEQ